MPSCLREKPGPEELVIARWPAAAAPITMLMPASSLSVCTKSPPASGMCEDMYSSISVCGVIG